MRPVIVIPVKPFALAKSRLAPALGPAARAELAEQLFRHVLATATALRDEADVLVVSRDATALQQACNGTATALAERRSGHNAALAQALLELGRDRRAPVLIVSCDLPRLAPGDLRAMLTAGQDAPVVIATDRARQGTNALFLATPSTLPPCFGPASRHQHETAAAARSLACTVLERPGLAFDIDEPDDLRHMPVTAPRLAQAGCLLHIKLQLSTESVEGL